MKRVASVLAKVVFCSLVIILIGDVVVVSWPNSSEKYPKRGRTKAQIASLGHQLDMYDIHIGHYPTEEEGGLKALLVKPCYADPNLGDKWQGPYINEDYLKDPWGQDFHFQLTPPGTPGADVRPFKLWSSGPDLKDGTEDDIRNW